MPIVCSLHKMCRINVWCLSNLNPVSVLAELSMSPEARDLIGDFYLQVACPRELER
jgi:hypothetical protein